MNTSNKRKYRLLTGITQPKKEDYGFGLIGYDFYLRDHVKWQKENELSHAKIISEFGKNYWK